MNWQEAIKWFNIEKTFHDTHLSNCPLIPKAITTIGEKWVEHPRRPSLFIHGNTGSGKTRFSLALFRGLLEIGYCTNMLDWMIYIQSEELDRILLNSISNKDEDSQLRTYKEVPILFIDDLGTEKKDSNDKKPSERTIRQYLAIINARYGNNLLTVYTSNDSKETIKEIWGDRIASRLHNCFEIEFPKKDNRIDL